MGARGCTWLGWVALALALVAPSWTRAEAPLITDLERQLFTQEGFDHLGFPAAVLVASGVRDPDTLKRQTALLEDALGRVVDRATREDPTLHPAERLMRSLHRHLLRSYRADLADVRVTLKTGFYNCLTATTLYVLAAQKAGLPVSAYGMLGHVMALHFDADGARYLEATDPNARLQRKFTVPENVYAEALQSPPTVDSVEVHADVDELAVAQMDGSDEGLVEVRRAPRTDEERRAYARRQVEKFMTTTSDEDPMAVAAMFYWNRWCLAAQGRTVGTDLVLPMLAFSALAAPRDAERTALSRGNLLQHVLSELPPGSVLPAFALVDAAAARTRSPDDRKAMLRARAHALKVILERTQNTARCPLMRKVLRQHGSDPTLAAQMPAHCSP